ncbi:MAG TPA: ABC transporter ATP-binding protein [Bryobacteraceae bacterium]|jgi:heme ABC exporter ATP-binding subunit CcmA
MTNAVEIEGVWKYYGDFPALRNIALTAAQGECIALLGRNGAGKTTLLRIAAGLLRPAKGSVHINGGIGWLGHGIGVYEELSAYENLVVFGQLHGVADPKKTATHWLERTGLDRVADALVREFSRGMRQRLAVARAFLHDPQVVLFDEPFTSLDDRAIRLLQTLFGEAIAQGRTVIMSTHQLREAMELATHVAMIQRGSLVHFGPRTAEMLADPGYLYRTYGES